MSKMSSAQRLKLKQMPLDTWAIREKLCLAMSVQRSGDQNWVSVSRSIKPFGEAERPADWFSQKNCAAQYSDLLEKTETPKRKRGEKVEIETPGDVIVRKLTLDRIEELKKLLQQEKMQYKKLKRDIEMVKNGQCDNRLHEISNEIRDQKRAEEIAAQELQKHYEEREMKINAHRLALKTAITPIKNRRAPAQQLKLLSMPQGASDGTPEQPERTQQLVREPLRVDVNSDDSSGNLLTPTAIPPIRSVSQSPRNIEPSPTSPLLSSLLKSPTPNTPGGPGPMSPAVSSLFASVTGGNNSKEVMTPHISPISSKQPITSPNTKFVSPSTSHPSTSPSSNTSPAVMSLFSGVTGPSTSPKLSPKSNQTSPSAGAPTLSKLLELPPSVPGRLPPLPVIKTEAPEATPTVPVEEEPPKEVILVVEDKPMEVEEDIKPEVTENSVVEESTSKKEEPSVTVEEKEVPKEKVETPVVQEDKDKNEPSTEAEPAEDEKNISADEIVEVKEEVVEVKNEKEEETFIEETKEDEEVVVAPSSDAFSDDKGKKSAVKEAAQSLSPATKVTKTRTPARRGVGSRRARSRSRSAVISEPPTPEEESLSQESAPGTPDASENTSAFAETSEDEVIHSTGGKVSIPSVQAASISDSVPNSPISHSDDPEAMKDYKLWKKSIMLVWRAAANHKYANVFLHPVTDDHAPGYSSVVLRPMDLSTIKKNVESGIIRTTIDFQRDLMLMFQNAILYNSSDQYVYKMAVEMQDEVMKQVEDFVATQLMVSTKEIKVLRGRGSDSSKRASTSEASDVKECDGAKKRKSILEEGRGKKKSAS